MVRRAAFDGVVVVGLVAAAAVGCSGNDGSDVPTYDNGILVQGDCDYTGTQIGSQSLLTEDSNPILQLPDTDEYGRIMATESEYTSFMFGVGYTTIPVPDFALYQTAGVWLATNTCGFSIEERKLMQKSDGSVVYDVQFFDASLNCATGCDDERQALVVAAFDQGVDASVCRRIRPGCPPEE